MEELSAGLPDNMLEVLSFMVERSSRRDFDATRDALSDALLERLDAFVDAPEAARAALLGYVERYMSPEEAFEVCRALLRPGSVRVSSRSVSVLRRKAPGEVHLPAHRAERGEEAPWDWTGMLRGVHPGAPRVSSRFSQHREEVAAVASAHGLPAAQTVGELCALLDIPEGLLGYLLISGAGEGAPYETFVLPKRGGGQRLICAPKEPLKGIQRRIVSEILSKVPAHDAAHGFVSGRSTVTNAAPHVGRALIVKFDLQDFFPSIGASRVVGLFASLGYRVGDTAKGRLFSKQPESVAVAPTLARLVTYDAGWSEARQRRVAPRFWLGRRRGLLYTPQGAPTSPMLSNLICRQLDARLTGLAERLGATYTRYADDLTFSMDVEPVTGLGRLRWWVDQICYQEGFLINYRKFRVVRRSQRQQVTGVVVNDTLNVPRAERRRMRAILHNCRKHGVASQARGRPRFAQWLRGYASYVHMVNPEEGARLLAEVDELLGSAGQQEGEGE